MSEGNEHIEYHLHRVNQATGTGEVYVAIHGMGTSKVVTHDNGKLYSVSVTITPIEV